MMNLTKLAIFKKSKMKKIMLGSFIIISLFSCKKNVSNIEGFIKIDKKFQDRENLIKKIKPDSHYDYWQYVYSVPGMANIEEKMILQQGDTLLKDRFKIKNPKKGFFNECHPMWCYSYIAYVQNRKVYYITNEKELQHFIGNINSLEEAILIAKINNLWFDPEEIKGGAYKKVKNGYELYLQKTYYCPIKYESIKVRIDSIGNFSSENKGVYYESEDCITF